MMLEDPFVLLSLLEPGRHVSPAALAIRLGGGVEAVGEAVAFLAALGVDIEGDPEHGYCLPRPLELLTEQAIRKELKVQAQANVSRLDVLRTVDSTNRYVAELAERGAPAGTVGFAECQTGGRGRRGRRWVSPFGQNVYLSLYTGHMVYPARSRGAFSLLVGLGVVEALGCLGVTGLCLKWPNDLMWDDSKIGGILIDALGERTGGMVVGVGLNVAMRAAMNPDIDQRWASLERLPGASAVSRARVAAAVIEGILEARHRLASSGLMGLVQDWAAYDCIAGRRVTIRTADGPLEGIACGIDESGRFLLDTGGSKTPFASGNVSLTWKA